MTTGLIDALVAQARRAPQRIVLPEVDDERIVMTARAMADRQIAVPLLLGSRKVVDATADAAGVDVGDIAVLDPADPVLVEDVIAAYLSLSDRLTEKTLRRKVRTPLNLACALAVTGHADAVAAGRTFSTSDVILAAQLMIGMQPGVQTVSSTGILEIPGYAGSEGELLAIADCAVCANPGPAELADIAAATATTVSDLLGWEPRVAMLSFSTKGSGDDPIVTKVIEAVDLLHQRVPDLFVDGELQLDAAIDPGVAGRKVPGDSPVAGRANVLIFPDLNAGNIGVKLVQQFAHAVAHGPVLQGFAAPVTDFSRGAPVEEMLGAIAIVAVRAQRQATRRDARPVSP